MGKEGGRKKGGKRERKRESSSQYERIDLAI